MAEASSWTGAGAGASGEEAGSAVEDGSGPAPAEPLDPWDLAVEQEKELQMQKHKIGLVLRGSFRIECKIGFGTYGSIYAAESTADGSRAAVKFEVVLDKHSEDLSTSHLFAESQIYKALEGGEGIPRVVWCGQEFGYNILIMDLLGPNLDQVHQFCDYRFSLSTVLFLGGQMLERLRWVHSAGYLHRDIKAANFLLGRCGDLRSVYLIDFGLAKSYRIRRKNGEGGSGGSGGEVRDWDHLEYREGRSMVGTARYASINSHRGCELSRRDDLEALGYVLLSFSLGSLPWQELKGRNKKARYKRMLQMKVDFSRPERLSSLPEPLGAYLRYVHRLSFAETPDYEYLAALFASARDSLPDWLHLLPDPRRRATWDIMFKWAPAPPALPPLPPQPLFPPATT